MKGRSFFLFLSSTYYFLLMSKYIRTSVFLQKKAVYRPYSLAFYSKINVIRSFCLRNESAGSGVMKFV